MGKFKHHNNFLSTKYAQSYLLPNVCFTCRKSFKKPASEEPRICPQCSGKLTALNRKFLVPRSSNLEQWKKVEFLVSHGFFFQSVFEQLSNGPGFRVRYPATLAESREFVLKYKSQATKNVF